MEKVRVRFPGSDREYTYGYDPARVGELRVGDRVFVPPNSLFKDPDPAEVVGLGSDWTGAVTQVLALARPEPWLQEAQRRALRDPANAGVTGPGERRCQWGLTGSCPNRVTSYVRYRSNVVVQKWLCQVHTAHAVAVEKGEVLPTEGVGSSVSSPPRVRKCEWSRDYGGDPRCPATGQVHVVYGTNGRFRRWMCHAHAAHLVKYGSGRIEEPSRRESVNTNTPARMTMTNATISVGGGPKVRVGNLTMTPLAVAGQCSWNGRGRCTREGKLHVEVGRFRHWLCVEHADTMRNNTGGRIIKPELGTAAETFREKAEKLEQAQRNMTQKMNELRQALHQLCVAAEHGYTAEDLRKRAKRGRRALSRSTPPYDSDLPADNPPPF